MIMILIIINHQKHSADGKVGDAEKEWARHFITTGFIALEQVFSFCYKFGPIRTKHFENASPWLVRWVEELYISIGFTEQVSCLYFSSIERFQIWWKFWIQLLSFISFSSAAEDYSRHLLRWQHRHHGRLLSCASGKISLNQQDSVLMRIHFYLTPRFTMLNAFLSTWLHSPS